MKPAHNIKTFVLVGMTLALTLQKGSGFLLVLLLPFFLIYLIVNVAIMIRRPAERKGRCIRLAIWSVAFVLAGAVQIYWSSGCRSNADLVVQKVLAYKENSGTYPANLRDVGLDHMELQKKWALRYSVKEGNPKLTYPAPVMPLTVYEYDFETLAWRQNAY